MNSDFYPVFFSLLICFFKNVLFVIIYLRYYANTVFQTCFFEIVFLIVCTIRVYTNRKKYTYRFTDFKKLTHHKKCRNWLKRIVRHVIIDPIKKFCSSVGKARQSYDKLKLFSDYSAMRTHWYNEPSNERANHVQTHWTHSYWMFFAV